MGPNLPDDFNAGVLPFELSDRLIPNLRRFRFPTDKAELGDLGADCQWIKEKTEGETRKEFLQIKHH
jgi:hypothetical protein